MLENPHFCDRLIRLSDVSDLTGFRKTRLYELISLGRFPKPVKLGRASRWPESEVLAWIEAAKASREVAANPN